MNTNNERKKLKRHRSSAANGVENEQVNGADEISSKNGIIQNESSVKVYKKKRRKVSTEHTSDVINKKNKHVITETSEEKNESSDKVTSIESEGLSGKYLRKAFASSSGFDELRKFVTVCTENKERDLAAEYIRAGGNILEVLRLLDASDKKNLSNAATVFAALNILIIKILAKFPQNQASAEEACRHLINSHLSSIHSMMSTQCNAKQHKVVLKLLTAIISLGGTLPRELLAHLSLQPKVIESLVQHTKPSDPQSVRTCYIHFILAFLIEGNVSVVRSLLDKQGALTSIFPGLIYDKREIVNLVLATVKKYVLENLGISKTLKLYVFSTPVVQSLVSLYNWKGPTNWAKGKRNNAAINNIPTEEKELVTDMVHDFLITLLTSHRYGIIFHDRTIGTSHDKHNQLVNTVLQSLDRPWEHAKPSDLVVKIMAACPDLIRPQFNYLEAFLEPRVSTKWIRVMTFIKRIIQTVDAEMCLKICSPELNISQLTNAIGALCIPLPLIKTVIVPSLNHSSMIVRHEGIELLLVMINQMKKFLPAIKSYSTNVLEIKNSIMDYVIKTVPNLNTILKVWTDAFIVTADENNLMEDDSLSEPSKQDHFSTILNVLHAYNDTCPELLDTPLNVQPSLLLSGLNNLCDIDDDELIILRIKAIQVLLALDSFEFAPSKDTFTETFLFLCFLINENSSVVSSHAKETVKMILIKTGIFEGCYEQIDIWINGLCNTYNSVEKTEIVDWFIKVIKTTTKHMDKYVNMIIEAEEAATDEIVNANKLKDIFQELYTIEDRKDKSKNIESFYMQSATSISPILCCAIHKLKKAPSTVSLQYVSYILIHTLHCQVNPEPLIYLIKDIQDLQAETYLFSWSSNNSFTNIPKIFPSMSMMRKLSKALLKDSIIQLNQLFSGDVELTFKYENEEVIINYTLSTYEIMILLKMTVFYCTNDIRKNTLNEIRFNNYKKVIICLLHIANATIDQDNFIHMQNVVKTVLYHPIILQHFSLYQDDNGIETMITNLILDICEVVTNLCQLPLADLLIPYKNKALVQIEKIVNKSLRQSTSAYKNIILLQQLQFTAEDIVYLLITLSKLKKETFVLENTSNLSICGYIFPKLLQLLCDENARAVYSEVSKLDRHFVKKVCSYLIFLKSNNVTDIDQWETALQKYLHHFPHNIAGIDTNTFKLILKSNIEATTVKLISFLLNRNIKFLPSFVQYAVKSANIKENTFILSIIESNLRYEWKQDLIQKLSDSYKDEILHYISHPAESKKWIEENVNVICYIIDHTFDIDTCKNLCCTVLQSGDQLAMVHTCYIKILQSLYYKYAALKEDNVEAIMDFIQILLHITTLTLKKESKNMEKLAFLCKRLNSAINYLKEKKNDVVFEDLSKNHSWSQFTRFSLKLGLKLSKDNKTYVPILKTLCTLCDVAYENDSDSEYIKTLFEMTTSHSEFVNTMLSSSTTKRDLVELLWNLIRKNKSVMLLSHIPLYLAAYNATLSESDQFILLILQYYERNGIKINEYRPYLWSNAAAIHYSVKSDASTALWRQPSTSEVLALFEKEVVENTIKHYPVNRSLQSNELHSTGDIYDPAFYLPLLCYLLSDNNIVACYKVTHSGALALILMACSSNHSEVRMAAYTAISRYYFHLESSSSKEKLLWMRLIDSLRNGILSTESNLEATRLSCLVSTFLARTSLIATQPLHPLYLPLHNFLMVKPALDLNTIPELLQLFHSSDIQHKDHRHWILETIRDGIKMEKDVEVASKCMLYKMLLDFFTCILSDIKTKKLILEVIESSTKIPKSCLLLVRGYGLIPWLTETVVRLEMCETECATLLIDIVCNISDALSCAKQEYDCYKIMLLRILLSLKSHLTRGLGIRSFGKYLDLLQKLLTSKDLENVINKQDMKDLVGFARNLVGQVNECQDILNHGCEFVNKAENSNSNDESEITRKRLQALVWTWCRRGTR
ncbi:hypothetical protein KPH14_003572 [Odynerus spinipes]|uniref:Nucleolar pre-ribosomal-associated protein 1 n=1 Tax=Odynerus spinipes TaxID=1348599 RepID=A0AAD9VJW6_9HYME|nr:hypothetical protein KPH14_003572 [Odynerus spinipes]